MSKITYQVLCRFPIPSSPKFRFEKINAHHLSASMISIIVMSINDGKKETWYMYVQQLTLAGDNFLLKIESRVKNYITMRYMRILKIISADGRRKCKKF